MSKLLYRLSAVQDGSQVSDEEEFSTVNATIKHLFLLERRNSYCKVYDKIHAKIEQAERKELKDAHHYSAVKEGLEEALAILEKEWK